MGFTSARLRDLVLAAQMHDVGKIGLPPYILKKTAALTDDEWDQIKQHPRKGWDILSRVHDMDGRISLLLLQVEIAQRPADDPAAVIRASAHRNPYTGAAFDYDAQAGIVSFRCLESVYHPPDPPPRCAVAIRHSAN